MYNQTGVVLIITLWILLILSTIALGFAFEMHLESRLARYQLDLHAASELAQAGINRAMVELKNDLILDRKARPQVLDTVGENWANNENSDEYYTNIELGDGKYSVLVTDEYSKININSMTREMFVGLLTVMHPDLENDEDQTNLMADALTDYRDADTQYWKDTTIDEVTYYNPESTDTAHPKYQMKNAPFETVDELLNLPGITPELLYGRVELDAEGGRKRNLYELFTVHGTGQININTAPYPVLVAWFRSSLSDLEQAQNFAKEVIERRDGLDEEPGTDDDKPFISIGEINTLPGMNPGIANVLMGRGMVNTNLFEVTATGEVHGAQKTVIALISRNWVVRQLTEEEKEYIDSENKTNKEGVVLQIKQWNEN